MGKLDEFGNFGKALSGLTSAWNTGLGYFNNNEAAVGKNYNQDLVNQRLQALLNADQDYDVFNTGAQAQAENNQQNYQKALLANQLSKVYSSPDYVTFRQQLDSEGIAPNSSEYFDRFAKYATDKGDVGVSNQMLDYAKQRRDQENAQSNVKQVMIEMLNRQNLGNDIRDIGYDKDLGLVAYVGDPVDPNDPNYDPNFDTYDAIPIGQLKGAHEAMRALQTGDLNVSEPALIRDTVSMGGLLQRDQANKTREEIANTKAQNELDKIRLKAQLAQQDPVAQAKYALQHADIVRKAYATFNQNKIKSDAAIDANPLISPEQKVAAKAKAEEAFRQGLDQSLKILSALNVNVGLIATQPIGTEVQITPVTTANIAAGPGVIDAMGSSLANIDFQGNNQNSVPKNGAPPQLLQPSQDINPFIPDKNADTQLMQALQQIIQSVGSGRSAMPKGVIPFPNDPISRLRALLPKNQSGISSVPRG